MRVGIVLASLLVTSQVAADPPAPVVVVNASVGRVRVLVSEGRALPCDSTSDAKLFDGTLEAGDTWRTLIGSDCVCIMHTSADFPHAEWSTPGLACRPRVCRGKRCWPAGDPTIRLSIVR